MSSRSAQKTVGVTAFKSQCLSLIDAVAKGKTDRVILLKRNRPVAAIVPVRNDTDDSFDLWGAMRGTVSIVSGVDLTESTEEVWDAEQ